MGEVYRPEDIIGTNKKHKDLTPDIEPITRTNLRYVIQEIKSLKAEVEKIKTVLKNNGIPIE
jgi:hypothetical protein